MKENIRKKAYLISALFLILIAILAVCYTFFYDETVYRIRDIATGESQTSDYKIFASVKIKNAPPAFNFKMDNSKSAEFEKLMLSFDYKDKGKASVMEDFLKINGTTAFVVIQDDTVLYEKYLNGSMRDSINTSFSVAKSFVSALVGIAIDEGYIKSVDEPITNYIPELKAKGFEKVTIKHLLTMSSGIRYDEDLDDDTITYLYPNLRDMAPDKVELVSEPGEAFLYNNYHPLLLGIILERATQMHVSDYLQEKIWKPLGMEYAATWSIDSSKHRFEKMESGLNVRTIDYAKFGRLFLNKGNWNGKQIISKEWIDESTRMDNGQTREYYNNSWFKNTKIYYKYFWYGIPRENGEYDFFAWGKYGQHIYICPSKNIIIARNGYTDGNADWPGFFYYLCNKME